MTKKLRLLLIAVFALVAFVCLFVGCSLTPTLDEVLNDLNGKGAVVDVTYFSNEGSFASNSKITNLRIKPGGKAAYVGETLFVSGDISVSRTKHRLIAWYKAETVTDPETGMEYPLYEDGSVYKFEYDPTSFDSSKNIKKSAEQFNFNTVLEKGTHYYLVAAWEKIETVQVRLAGEVDSLTYTDLKGKEVTYERDAEDPLNDIEYEEINGQKVIPSKPSAVLGTVKDATFVEFYYKETCKKEDLVTWPLYFSDHDEEDFTIYAKYIEGTWTVVSDSAGVERMFKAYTASYNYYILDEAVIEYDGETIKALTISNGFGCKIRGNGATITGLKVSSSFTGNSLNASLFGAIKATAEISDLTFLEVEEEYTVNMNASVTNGIFFAFTSVAAGATISNVEISGTMTVKLSTNGRVANLNGGATNHWKFGGFDNDSDYTGGISVTATLNVVDN